MNCSQLITKVNFLNKKTILEQSWGKTHAFCYVH